MTSNMTDGFDIVVELSESTINSLVGISNALPLTIDEFFVDTSSGFEITGRGLFHILPPGLSPESISLDTPIENGILLTLAFYSSQIEVTSPMSCRLDNLIGTIYVIGRLDIVAPVPNERYVAIVEFLASSVTFYDAIVGHINESLRDCSLPFVTAGHVEQYMESAIDSYLHALIEDDGHLTLHDRAIEVHPGSSNPLHLQDVDLRVIHTADSDPPPVIDALALLLATLGTGGDAASFSSLFLPGGEHAMAIAIDNDFFIRHFIRPQVARALAIAPDSEYFDPAEPCRLAREWTRTLDINISGRRLQVTGHADITIESLEVLPDDRGCFTMPVAVNVEVILDGWGELGRLGGGGGTLVVDIYLELSGTEIVPRVEIEQDITVRLDRDKMILIAMAIWGLFPFTGLATFFWVRMVRREREIEETIATIISDLESELNNNIPPIETREFIERLGMADLSYEPEDLIVDDILIPGRLWHERGRIPCGISMTNVSLQTEWSFDLDRGESIGDGPAADEFVADFKWDRFGGLACIAPTNGASIVYLDRTVLYAELTRHDLELLHYREDIQIPEDLLPLADVGGLLNVQTDAVVFAMVTSRGRYSKVRVHPMVRSSSRLLFDFCTYD